MEDSIINLSDENKIIDLKKQQEKNSFISKHAMEFYSVCNKILDFLYDERDIDTRRENPKYKDDFSFNKTIEDFELIRKKVHRQANLSSIEINQLLIASQFVASDLLRLSQDFIKASKQLEEYIKILTSMG